jgi:hypothetical protein
MNDYSDRWDVYDRYGNKIYMTAERWNHALESRPWLETFHEQALNTLRHGRRKQDPLNPQKYKYYHPLSGLLPEFNHLVVIVLLGNRENPEGHWEPNNYVTNVWAVYLYQGK